VSEAGNASHTEHALRGLRYIGVARAFTQPVSWALTAITIHLLQPRDYGLVATAGVLLTFAQLLLDGGLAEILISQRELPARLQGAAISAVMTISSLLAAAIFVVAPFASSFFHSPPLRAVLEVSAFSLPLSALAVVPVAQLSKRMQFARIALVQTTTSIATGVLTLAMAYAGAAYWSLILGNILGSGLLRVAMLWMSVDEKPVPNLFFNALRPLLRNSTHMLGQRLTYFFIENFDIFLLSRLSGASALGSYSVAKTLSQTPLDRLSGLTSRVSVPTFAAKTETSHQLRGALFVISVTSTLAFPLWWVGGVASQIGLPLVFGSRWHELIIPFLAFSLILPLRTIYAFLDDSLVGTGRTGISLKNVLTWAALLLPCMLLGVKLGAVGVALSWTVAFPLIFYIAMRRTSRAFSIPASVVLKPMVAPAICAGASALAAQSALWLLSGRAAPLVILILQCCIASVCYLLLLRSLAREQCDKTLYFLRRLFRK
jgi:teichuronic acid exporter